MKNTSIYIAFYVKADGKTASYAKDLQLQSANKKRRN